MQKDETRCVIFSISGFGVLVTLSYIAGIAWLRWPFSVDTLSNLPMNELGDFLAGVFGPLSLFWLILGFLLQKNELKQNREALLLQAQELRDTLHQHKEAVATSKNQLQADLKANEFQEMLLNKEVRPRFAVLSVTKVEQPGDYDTKSDTLGSTGVYDHTIEFVNDGAPAANTTIMSHLSDRALATDIDRQHYVNTGERIKISWSLEDGNLPEEASVMITYYDKIERQQSKEFCFKLTEDKTYKSTNWNYAR